MKRSRMRRFILAICLSLLFSIAVAVVLGSMANSNWRLPAWAFGNSQSSGVDALLTAVLPKKSRLDSLVAEKRHRLLTVYENGKPLKVYRFSLGDAPSGHKQFQGDEKTPEGLYYITDRNPNSICHKNLGISYPNARDRAFALAHGRSPGGDIKIHGLPNGQGHIGVGHLAYDWTNGCIAVTDEEVDELYEHVEIGSPILILP
jgi:murein L,D-transpeptidase YafK